jgi:hypothetical protein
VLAKLLHGVKPVLVRRSFGATARLPELVSPRLDIPMPESLGAVPHGIGVGPAARFPRELKRLPGPFVRGQMFRLAVLFSGAVRVRGAVVEFGRTLVVLVVRSVVVSG